MQSIPPTMANKQTQAQKKTVLSCILSALSITITVFVYLCIIYFWLLVGLRHSELWWPFIITITNGVLARSNNNGGSWHRHGKDAAADRNHARTDHQPPLYMAAPGRLGRQGVVGCRAVHTHTGTHTHTGAYTHIPVHTRMCTRTPTCSTLRGTSQRSSTHGPVLLLPDACCCYRRGGGGRGRGGGRGAPQRDMWVQQLLLVLDQAQLTRAAHLQAGSSRQASNHQQWLTSSPGEQLATLCPPLCKITVKP